MSTIDDRLDNLREIVEEAESFHNDPESKKLRTQCAGIVNTMADMDKEQPELMALFNAAQAVRSYLGFEGNIELEAGNEAAEKVKGLYAADIWEDPKQKDEATDLIDRWNSVKKYFAAKKQRDKNDVVSVEPDFGFGMVAFCNECDKIIAEEGKRAGTTRWAHLKHLVKQHHGDHEPEDFGTRDEWTSAKEEVANGAHEVNVGQYKLYRS